MPRRNTIALLLDGKPAVEGSVNQGDYVECTTSEVRPRCDDGIAPPTGLFKGPEHKATTLSAIAIHRQ